MSGCCHDPLVFGHRPPCQEAAGPCPYRDLDGGWYWHLGGCFRPAGPAEEERLGALLLAAELRLSGGWWGMAR
jgi:hypothetical protein